MITVAILFVPLIYSACKLIEYGSLRQRLFGLVIIGGACWGFSRICGEDDE